MSNNKGIKSLWGYPLIDSKGRNAIDDVRSNLENNFQKKTDDTLTTTNKSIVGAINEVNVQYKEKANKSELDVERNRINNLLALPADSSINNARLEDICIGIDSTTYATPGEAVRSQLKKIITIEENINLFDKNSCEFNKRFLSYKGDFTDTDRPNFGISNYIPVQKGSTYIFTTDKTKPIFGGNAKIIVIYDSNKNVITTKVDATFSDNFSYAIVTIPSDINIAYIRINIAKSVIDSFMFVKGDTLPSNYVSYNGDACITLNSNVKLSNTQLELNNKNFRPNNLYGKVAVFDGDSICHGTSAGDGLNGWAGRIGTKNNMTWKNFGISGGTIISGLTTSSGQARHWISTNIDAIYSEYPNADYIILEGGTNDADLLHLTDNPDEKMGVISNNYLGEYDTSTFIGAVETLFYKAITYYPTKKIGFIIAHKMGAIKDQYKTAYRNVYFDKIRELCKKWGIPYLDLWNECHLCQDIPKIKQLMYADSQHLTSAGYDYISPIIEEFMNRL